MAGPKVYFLQSFRLPSLPCCGEGCAGGGGGCGYGAVFVMSVCLFEVLYTVFSFHFISRLWRRHHPHDANFSTTRIVAAGVRKIWKVHSGWKIRPEKKRENKAREQKKDENETRWRRRGARHARLGTCYHVTACDCDIYICRYYENRFSFVAIVGGVLHKSIAVGYDIINYRNCEENFTRTFGIARLSIGIGKYIDTLI